jgi:hypothetical protein
MRAVAGSVYVGASHSGVNMNKFDFILFGAELRG